MKFVAILLAAVLSGCAAVGAVAPQSLDEGLAAAESQVTGLEQSMATAVSSGVLKPADAQAALGYADQAVAAIDAAHAAEKAGDTTTAQGKLSLVTSLVAQLATYLTAHGVK